MNRFNKFLIAAFMSAAMLLPNMVQAMEFQQFDQMTSPDRQAFLNFLPQAAQTVLNQEGRSDDATKVFHLFNDISPGSDLPLGEAELELNVGNARVADAKRAIQDPSLPRIQVEAALAVTLKKNGIALTPDFVKALMQLTGAPRR